jgi:hypothetical protein
MASPDRFDGLEVDQHQARFSGTVELDPTDADRMSIDTQFMAVVVCTVGGATVADNAKGELIRTNKFKLDHFAVVRDGQMQEALYKALPLVGPVEEDPQLSIETALADENGEAVDPSTPPTGRDELTGALTDEEPEPEPEEEIDPDEEIFTPGVSRPVASQPQPVGAPGPANAPRQYDPALSAFLRE